jgi:ParB-like chromosome segregation protein Spo0J
VGLIKKPHLVAQDDGKATTTAALQLLPEDRETITLNITELHSLKDIVKGTSTLAMRDIDPNHVETLSSIDPQLWPPISVTKTSVGYVYYDGQHRLHAANLLKLETIQATCKTFEDINELIEAAFRANLRHGLPASLKTRSDYCYWLSITYSHLSQRQIAARVGVTQSTVSRAIDQRKKQEQEIQQEEEASPESGQLEQWKEGVVKRVKTFVRSVSKFPDTVKTSEHYTELVRELQYELVQVPEDRQTLLFAGQLLLDTAKLQKKGKNA